MIDEEHALPSSRHESDADSYLYDFFKFLTSLSVLTLAGIFAVSQAHEATEKVGKFSFAFTMACVALGGMLSFMGAMELVRLKVAGEGLNRKIAFLTKVAPIFYALGIGGFLLMFTHVLF
jgi:hypothetical protein